MAIWQFDFSIVPASGIRMVHGTDATLLPRYGSSAEGPNLLEPDQITNYWLDRTILDRAFQIISSRLPETKSWSEESRFFGHQDSNLVEIWPDDVLFQADLRHFSSDFISLAIFCASECDCKIVLRPTGRVIEPSFEVIRSEILKSDAYRFCVNPSEFLIGAGLN